MSNRLVDSTSPYLLQHAHNPVHWWPWCDEAFAEARERDVPVLLSVGYAACHWCHVMAHESFEDPEVAALMNAGFVNVKVDREERPDIDAVYMAATQAMTGHGGWPMTCFLTPAGEPFHCGTYFPPAPRHGMPSFRQLLAAVAEAWTSRDEEIRGAGAKIVEHLAGQSGPLTAAVVDDDGLDGAVVSLLGLFDRVHGGFGGAPKFPPAMVLEFLLRHHERTGSADALTMVAATASAMASGGMYDQLGGGFARYSVDAAWVVPHFEKMLYDNALLLRLYTHLGRGGQQPRAREVAEQTAAFLLADLRTAQGGFASSLDADTDGVEGATFVWTPAQLAEVLGAEDGAWAAELCGVTAAGTFEHGTSTLRLPREPTGDEPVRWASVRARLLDARSRRPQPGRDDKVVTAWNGLAIAALAEAGTAFGVVAWIDAAVEAASLLVGTHLVDGRLRRASRDGVVGEAAGVLEDYGCLAEGLLVLHAATADPRWLTAAAGLLDTALARFADERGAGAYFDTADDATALVWRPSDPQDNATPSGASSLASALLLASVLAGAERADTYRAAAEEAVARAGLLATRAPRAAGHWLTVAEALRAGPVQVAIVGTDPDEVAVLRAAAHRSAAGGTVVVSGSPSVPGVPLLADRGLVDGVAAAYVCHGYVCDHPVTTADALTRVLT